MNPSQTTEASRPWERAGLILLGSILFLLPLFFWISANDQFELPKLTLLRILSSVLAGAWVLSNALGPRWVLRRTPLDLPVLAWSAWLLFKTLHSVSPWVSWRGEYENFAGSLTQLNYSLLFFAATQLARSLQAARRLLAAFEFSALAVGMYAVFQALGVDPIAWSKTSVVMGRYFASMGNPNFLGALMVMALALAAGRGLMGGQEAGRRALWLRLSYFAALPLAWTLAALTQRPIDLSHAQPAAKWVLGAYGLCLLVLPVLISRGATATAAAVLLGAEALVLFKALSDTGTRGAFAGLLAVVAFYLVLGLRGAWLRMRLSGVPLSGRWLRVCLSMAFLLAALAAASLALGPELRRRMAHTLSHPFQAFDESRMQIWIPAINIWKDFPLTGSGVDSFKTVFPQYAASKFSKYDGDNVASRMAHSEPLQVLSTMGIIGLVLWLWLLASWSRAWIMAWLERDRADAAAQAVLAGLGGLALGYVVQNLVSFGVSAISAPFFISLGLLWAISPAREKAWRAPSFVRPAAAAAAFLAAVLGPWAASKTFRADHLYNFGHMVSSQTAILEKSSLIEARSACLYALDQLQKSAETLTPEQAGETALWYEKLRVAEGNIRATPLDESRDLPLYRSAAQALLYVLSSLRQEQAVRLCPGEVKYHVYLGLAYEELSKRSQSPQWRKRWFERAEGAYVEGTRLNPRNAYYHGNLGRLYSQRAEGGEAQYLAKAEQNYLDAVALGPVTRLFYENLILLHAQFGLSDRLLPLLAPLDSREPALAARLYFSGGTTFYQYASQMKAQPALAPKAAARRAQGLKAISMAKAIDPANPDIPYTLGAIHYFEGDKKKAKVLINEALALDPSHGPTLNFLKTSKF